jgi:diguanylate cyclase (GGDEF)-like protein
VVSSIIDCDRAIVVLLGAGDQDRSVGSFGYDQETESLIRDLAQAIPPSLHERNEIIWHDPGDPYASRGFLPVQENTALGVTIVIRVEGETIGWVSTDVIDRPERLRDQPDLATRLYGLAGHVSVAVRNARLLAEIRHQSLHDQLTGLPNRKLILDRTEQMLTRARRNSDLEVALLFVDLDGFKAVNDTFGHEAGDELLREVATRFVGTMREMDTVGRLGGDEFVVLCEGSSMMSGLDAMTQRLIDCLEVPFVLEHAGQIPTTVSASIGVAVGLREHAQDLLRDGDIALYAAKAAGKRRFAVFEPGMGTAIRTHYELDMSCASPSTRTGSSSSTGRHST